MLERFQQVDKRFEQIDMRLLQIISSIDKLDINWIYKPEIIFN
jgi:hypothetical protein